MKIINHSLPRHNDSATAVVKSALLIAAFISISVMSVQQAFAQEITAFSKAQRNVNDPTGNTINNLTGGGDMFQIYTISVSCTGADPCTVKLQDDIAGMAIAPVVSPGQPSATLVNILDSNGLAPDAQEATSITNNMIDLDLTIPPGGSFEIVYRVRIPNQRFQDGTTFTNSATITPTAPTTVATGVVTTAQQTATLEAAFMPRVVKNSATFLATGNRRVRYTVSGCSDAIADASEILYNDAVMNDMLEPGTVVTDLNGWTLISPIPADGSNITDPVHIRYTDPTSPNFSGCFTAPTYEVFYPAPQFQDGHEPDNTVVFTGTPYGETPFSISTTETSEPLASVGSGTNLVPLKLARIQDPDTATPDIVPPQSQATTYQNGAVNTFYFPFTLLNTDGEIFEVVLDEPAAGTSANFFDFHEVYQFGFTGATFTGAEFAVFITTAEIGNPAVTSGPTIWTRCPAGDLGSSPGYCRVRPINQATVSGGGSVPGTLTIPAGHYITGLQFRVRKFNAANDPGPLPDNFETEELTGLFFNGYPRATSLADGSPAPSDPLDLTNCGRFTAVDDNGDVVNSSFGAGDPLDLTLCDEVEIDGSDYATYWTDYVNIGGTGPYTIGDTVSYHVNVREQSPHFVDPNTARATNPIVEIELAPGLIFTGVAPHDNATIAAAPENALPTCNVVDSVGTPARQILSCSWPAGTGMLGSTGIKRSYGQAFRIDTIAGPTVTEGTFRTNLALTADLNPLVDGVNCNRSVVNTTDAAVFTSGENGDTTTGAFEFAEVDPVIDYLGNPALTSFVCRDAVDTIFLNAGAFRVIKLVSPGNVGQVVDGITRPGEASSWNLLIQNTTDDAVDNLLVYDKLPFVGDTSILTGMARNSDFVGPLTGPATNTVTVDGVPMVADPAVLVEYSTEANPCFDDPINAMLVPANQYVQPMGCTPDAIAFVGAGSVADFSLVQWLKVTRVIDDDPGTTTVEQDLGAQTVVQIEVPMLTPADRVTGDKIVNDFSAAANVGKLDSQTASLTVADGEISNRVWFDINSDGLQDATDIPVQGVTVVLLDTAGNPVLQPDGITPYSTVTDVNGDYLFDSLIVGNYIVEFDWSTATNIPASATPASISVTTQDVGADDTIDSDGAATTGTLARAPASLLADADGLPINNPDVDLGLLLPTSLEVTKTVEGFGAIGSDWSFEFTLTPAATVSTDISPATNTGNTSDVVNWTLLAPGTVYILTETANVNYMSGALTCTGVDGMPLLDADGDTTDASITFTAAGGTDILYDIDCAITNTALMPDVQVTKTVDGQGTEGPIDWSFDFSLLPAAIDGLNPSPATNTGNGADVVNWTGLTPGASYVLAETAQTGYSEGVLTCTGVTDLNTDADPLTVEFVAPLGDDNDPAVTYEVNCAITNTADVVQAQVTKTVAGVDDAQTWDFDFTITPTTAAAPTPTSMDLIASGTGNTTSADTIAWTDLMPGAEYVIAEAAEAGYTLGTMTCTGVTDTDAVAETVTFIAPIGDSDTATFEVDCVITNTALMPDVQVTKTVDGQGTEGPIDWSFDFSLLPAATDGSDTSPATNTGNASDVVNWTELTLGTTYVLAETAQTGYSEGVLTCTGVTDLNTDADPLTVEFVAPLGDGNDPAVTYEVNCAITNTADVVQAQVTKTVAGVDDAQTWDFDFTITPTTAAAPTPTSMDLIASGTGNTTSADTIAWTDLMPGAEYVIAEAAEAGYTLGTMTCTGVTDSDAVAETVTFIAPIGDSDTATFEIDCAITNIPLSPDVRLIKTVESNATEDWSFDFTLEPTATAVLPSPATGNGGGMTTVSWSGLIPGTEYTIAETTTGLVGYTAGALSCTGVVDTDLDDTNASVTFIAPLGDTNNPVVTFEIECAIINQQWPDLLVEKSVTPAAAASGGTLTFSIEVSNEGILPATGVELTDLLPEGLVYASDTPSQGSFDSATGIWTVGDIAGGVSATLALETTLEPITGTCASDYVNTASVTAQGEVDFDTTDNADSATVNLVSVGLSKRLSDDSPIDNNGVQQVTYEFAVVNTGGEDLINIQIVDDLVLMINTPNVNNATFVVTSIVSPDSTLSPNAAFNGDGDLNVLTGSDTLAAGATGHVNVIIEITPDVYFGPFINTATVTGETTAGVITQDISENGDGNPLTKSPCVYDEPTLFSMDTPSTPITLGWFNTQVQDDGVLFGWGTELEVSNAGFYLSVETADGEWERLNSEMIEAVGDSTMAHSYEHFVPNVQGSVFRFSDVSVHGKIKHHGPFELGRKYGVIGSRTSTDWQKINRDVEQRKLEREQKRRLEMQRRIEQIDEPQSSIYPQGNDNDFKSISKPGVLDKLAFGLLSLLVSEAQAVDLANFEISQPGIYRLTHADLQSAGINLAGVDPQRIGLQTDNKLAPINVETGAAAIFTNTSYIEFPAQGKHTLYTGVNQYTLTLDEGQNLISEINTKVPLKGAATSYLAEADYSEQNHYTHISPDPEDTWYADRLMAISRPAQKVITLSLDNQANSLSSPLSFGGLNNGQLQGVQAKPTLHVKLWGASAMAGNGVENPDHHVLVYLNGEQVADQRFDGLRVNTIEQPLASVAQGNNEVTIVLPKDHGYSFDLVNLDRVSLTYPRRFVAMQNGKSLVFSSSWDKFRVRELASDNIIVYRIDEQSGEGYAMSERGSEANDTSRCDAQGCMVVFAGSDVSTKSQYFIATDAGIMKPPIRLAVNSESLFARQANALIIAHPNFIDTQNQLLETYAGELSAIYGSAEIVSTESIYAEYSGHVEDAYAIYRYIQDAYEQLNTRHLIIVGGDTYDYHNNLKLGAQSFVPFMYVPIAQNLYSVPSDAKYADVDDDSIPDITVTRLPVRTVSELQSILDKRTKYLNRSYSQQAVFVADKKDGANYSFKQDAEELINKHFSASWNVAQAYLDDIDVNLASQNLIGQINSGVALTSYFGHSSTDRWSANGVFRSELIDDLSNSQSPTVVTQWGCWNTYSASPEEDSMAERWLLGGEQGAVVVMGATSLTKAAAEKRMADLLYERLLQGMRIGDAVLSAKQALASETPYQLDILLGWTVLGPSDLKVN